MDFNINPAKIAESFDRIADELMNNHAIKIKEHYYRIVDCEFYFQHKSSHIDVYVHGHEEQKKNGSWYFHGSGVDITIGNEEENSKGGILIRGIAKLSKSKNANSDYIEVDKRTIGPLNVLTTLFSHFSDVFNTTNSFYLVEKGTLNGLAFTFTKMYKVSRVGLNSSVDKDNFHDRPYRYITFPYLPHRDKEKIQKYLKYNANMNDDELKVLFTLKYAKG